MYKIGNALIIDDEIDLTLSNDKDQLDKTGYQSLRSIQKYFLRNSIPFSVINQLGSSLLDALELMKSIPKPDLVVLDLDLDSDGDILDVDRDMIRVILKQLFENFGTFVLLIYSSQIDEWSNIKSEILEIEPSLERLLKDENVIVMEKFIELDSSKSEKLGVELLEKGNRYFQENILRIEDFIKSDWNKEVSIIAFFFLVFILVIYVSLPHDNSIMFIVASIVIFITSLMFVVSNRKVKRNE